MAFNPKTYVDNDPRTPILAADLNAITDTIKSNAEQIQGINESMVQMEKRIDEAVKKNTGGEPGGAEQPGSETPQVDAEQLKNLVTEEVTKQLGEKPAETISDEKLTQIVTDKLRELSPAQATDRLVISSESAGTATLTGDGIAFGTGETADMVSLRRRDNALSAKGALLVEGTVSASEPTEDAHLATKKYVDSKLTGAETPGPVVTAVSDPGVAWVHDSRFGTVEGGDITANLQAAINDEQVKVIKIPTGEHKIKSVNIDKLSNKVLEGAGRDVTKLVFDKSATNHAFIGTSGGKLTSGVLRNFTLDMAWSKGDTLRNGMQLSNSKDVDFTGLRILNSGGTGILIQSLGNKPTDLASGSLIDDVEFDGIGLGDGTTGFGITLKGNAGKAHIRNVRMDNIKGGMGIGGVDDTSINMGPSNVTIEGCFLKTVEGTTAFEPIGFTKMCHDILVIGNHLWSFDNGTSLSGGGQFKDNFVYQSWNFGVAVGDDSMPETFGSIVSGNTFYVVGAQNKARSENTDYGVVRLSKPRQCVVTNNVYKGADGELAHFLVIRGTSGGANQVANNAAVTEQFTKAPVLGAGQSDKVQTFESRAAA